MRTERKLKTAPAIEPVSLEEMKSFLRISSVDYVDSIEVGQSIAAGAHVIAANYSLIGSSVDVLGVSALVVVDSGTNGAGGTVTIKLQDSDDNATWSDVTSGSFTAITTGNDNAIYTKQYTGAKQYLRAVATVANATCDFGVNVHGETALSADDTLLAALITAARELIEQYTNRALITQTWYYYLQCWPLENYIELPFGNLQSISAITYKDTDGSATTIDASEYIAETGSYLGRVVLAYGEGWPASSLYPSLPITVEYVCGYGATAASVPGAIKIALMELVSYWYENRDIAQPGLTIDTMPTISSALLATYRLVSL